MVKYFIYLTSHKLTQREKSLVRIAETNQWEYEIHKEVLSVKRLDKRLVIKQLLIRLSRKEADGLMVTSPDRLTRKVLEATYILDIYKKYGWKLYVDSIRTEEWGRLREEFIDDVIRSERELAEKKGDIKDYGWEFITNMEKELDVYRK